MKAYLVSIGLRFARIHDLLELAKPIYRNKPELETLLNSAGVLTKYVVAGRYPTELEITLSHAKEAIQIADKVYQKLQELYLQD